MLSDVIQSLQKQKRIIKTLFICFPSPPFWKFFKKLPTHSTPLFKLTAVSKYGKLEIMDWNIYGMCLFLLKIFSQSIFICPINMPKLFKSPSSNCSGCSVRLYDAGNSIFLNLRRNWLLWIDTTFQDFLNLFNFWCI